MISAAEWAQFQSDLATFYNEVGQQRVIWKHVTKSLDRFGEGSKTREDRNLYCLVSYNDFRVWPITKETNAGVIDKEYCYLLINNTWLTTQGWLTANNNFDFNPAEDLFEVNGVTYKEAGTTPAAQDKDSPLFTIVILKRLAYDTGDYQTP